MNCIFLGLPVSMVALSVKEEDRTKRRMRKSRRRENPYKKRRVKSSVRQAENK